MAAAGADGWSNTVESGPNDVRTADAISPIGVLTLPQAVTLATAYNHDYRREKDSLYATAPDQRLVRRILEVLPDEGMGEPLSHEAQVGSNRLLTAGGPLGAQVAASWTSIVRGSGDTGAASVFSISPNQPWPPGRDPHAVLEPLTQAQRDTLYQVRTFNRYRQSFVVRVIAMYYQVIQQRALARNAQEYRAALQAMQGRVDRLAEAGRLPRQEADRLHQDILTIGDMGLSLTEGHGRLLEEFKITLGLPMTAELELDEGALDELEKGSVPYPEFGADEAIEAALRRRLDVANSADAVIDAQRRELLTEPDSHRQGLPTLNQRLREYNQASDAAAQEVRQAYRKLKEAADQDRAKLEAKAAAKSRLKDATALLEYGRVSSRQVLDAQQSLLEAGNAAVKARVDYVVATLEFYRDVGSLRVKPDGMRDVPEMQQSALREIANKKP
jgi:hypothetical protein